MDPRRELSLINKHVRYRNREAGESLVWYEFKNLGSGGSVYDDVYDEGAPGAGGKSYERGLIIPTIYVEEVEDEFRAIDNGRLPTQNIRVTVLFKDLQAAGVSNPRDYQDHLNDVFEYDSRYYKVRAYKVRGRLHRESPSGESVVSITGYEIFPDQEMPFSFGPRNPEVYDLPWPPSFPS